MWQRLVLHQQNLFLKYSEQFAKGLIVGRFNYKDQQQQPKEFATAVTGCKCSNQGNDRVDMSRVLPGHKVILPARQSCIAAILAVDVFIRTEMLQE